jgi:hypothetical protein
MSSLPSPVVIVLQIGYDIQLPDDGSGDRSYNYVQIFVGTALHGVMEGRPLIGSSDS